MTHLARPSDGEHSGFEDLKVVLLFYQHNLPQFIYKSRRLYSVWWKDWVESNKGGGDDHLDHYGGRVRSFFHLKDRWSGLCLAGDQTAPCEMYQDIIIHKNTHFVYRNLFSPLKHKSPGLTSNLSPWPNCVSRPTPLSTFLSDWWDYVKILCCLSF